MKQLTLGELIEFLEQPLDTNARRVFGFKAPHSYRGYCNELAFEPTTIVPIEFMLDEAKSAIGRNFEGGGRMTVDTLVWIAEPNRHSPGDLKITKELLFLLFGGEL